MSAGFTERVRSPEELYKTFREKADLTLLVKTAWGAKYKLPPNDPRLLSLTVKGALEQLHADEALKRYAKGGRTDSGETQVYDDETAREIADTPQLTGDPEWEAMELAETNPAKDPIKVVR